jgi:hypothetical protein
LGLEAAYTELQSVWANVDDNLSGGLGVGSSNLPAPSKKIKSLDEFQLSKIFF